MEVLVENNIRLTCFTYEKKNKSQLGLPSIPYKDTIVSGALQCELPQDYIVMLQNIKDNGYHGEVDYKDGIE